LSTLHATQRACPARDAGEISLRCTRRFFEHSALFCEKLRSRLWRVLQQPSIPSGPGTKLTSSIFHVQLGGSLNLPPPAPVPIKNLQIRAIAPPAPQPPTVVRFTGPISVQRPSPCPSCCLKCPGGVCTKACNKMLLKEIFKKMYDSNKARISKLEFFMKENKKRIERSEGRVEK